MASIANPPPHRTPSHVLSSNDGHAMRTTPMCRLLILCLTAVAARAAIGQGVDPAATHAGIVTVHKGQQLGLEISAAAEKRAAFTAADAMVALLNRDDAIAKPVGYSVALTPVAGMTKVMQDDAPLAGSLHFGVTGMLSYFSMADNGRGGPTVTDQGGQVTFSVVVNAPGRLADAEELPTERDHGPSVLGNIRQTGEYRGHPIYNGECIVVSGHTAPPFVPLTMERYLRLLILQFRADSMRHAAQQPSAAETQSYLKGLTPEQAKNMEAILRQGPMREGQQIQEVQARLDSLSEADRRTPAAVIIHGVAWDMAADQLADIADTSSSPLVQLNPAFMDRTLPPTAPQIITICIPSLQGLENTAYDMYAGDTRAKEKRTLEQRTRDAVRIRDHLDWAALEAMVKP